MRFAPGTSQDEIMAAEKAFRDRFQNAAQNSGGGRGPAPVRDIVNPGIPAGLPPKSGNYSAAELEQLRAGVVRNGDMSSISRDVQARVNAERDARIRQEQANIALNQARADSYSRQASQRPNVSPPGTMPREAYYRPRPQGTPVRTATDLKDRRNQNFDSFFASKKAEQNQSDSLRAYEELLARLNLSKSRMR